MSKFREIEIVIPPREPHFVGDGFRVHNFIPSAFRLEQPRMNPFILLDYNSKFHFPASEKPRGVSAHPHRGFETVTIAYHGAVTHHDNKGGGGTIHQGDVQWMTAASGVLHKEYHEENFSKQGGIFQMVQLWINLPAKFKMSKPKYQTIKNADINKFQLANNQGYLELIAGEFQGVKGNATTFTPINLFNAKLKKGAEINFNFPADWNTGFLVIEGSIEVNQQENVPTDHFILFENNTNSSNKTIQLKALEDCIVLIMSAEPLNEPIVSYGPFVMNTQEEIRQASLDYSYGKFGELD